MWNNLSTLYRIIISFSFYFLFISFLPEHGKDSTVANEYIAYGIKLIFLEVDWTTLTLELTFIISLEIYFFIYFRVSRVNSDVYGLSTR